MKAKLGKQTINVKGGVRVKIKGGLPIPEEQLPEGKAKLDITARAHLTGKYSLVEKDGIYTLEMEAVIDRGFVEIAPVDPTLFDSLGEVQPHEFEARSDDETLCSRCGEPANDLLHRTDSETGEIEGEGDEA